MLYILAGDASPFWWAQPQLSPNTLSGVHDTWGLDLDQPYYVDPVICPIKIKISLGALDKSKN